MEKLKIAFQTICGMLIVLWLMPYLLTQLYGPIASTRAVQLWPLWLVLFAVGGYHANNIRSDTLRAWVGTPIALPAIFICPLALYHWAGTIIQNVM